MEVDEAPPEEVPVAAEDAPMEEAAPAEEEPVEAEPEPEEEEEAPSPSTPPATDAAGPVIRRRMREFLVKLRGYSYNKAAWMTADAVIDDGKLSSTPSPNSCGSSTRARR